MSLKLVDTSAKILQFQNKNAKESLDMLKQLLLKAESGQLVGIAGVFFTMDRAAGSFAAGEACERASDTTCELSHLQFMMQGWL